MTIAELNAADRDRFADALREAWEGSRWVAERIWDRRPFESIDALHAAMTRAVDQATRAEQLALLRAHPDLGARGRMSEASATEQAGAALDRLSRDERRALARLNAAYRRRFAFPFLFAVTGSTRGQVREALERRLRGGIEEEFAEALRQVCRIARCRLERLVE